MARFPSSDLNLDESVVTDCNKMVEATMRPVRNIICIPAHYHGLQRTADGLGELVVSEVSGRSRLQWAGFAITAPELLQRLKPDRPLQCVAHAPGGPPHVGAPLQWIASYPRCATGRARYTNGWGSSTPKSTQIDGTSALANESFLPSQRSSGCCMREFLISLSLSPRIIEDHAAVVGSRWRIADGGWLPYSLGSTIPFCA